MRGVRIITLVVQIKDGWLIIFLKLPLTKFMLFKELTFLSFSVATVNEMLCYNGSVV